MAAGVRSTMRTPVPASFGCQTHETGMFKSQKADGITGFNLQTGRSATLFSELVAATGAPDAFSLCYANYVGALVMGGALPAARRAVDEILAHARERL